MPRKSKNPNQHNNHLPYFSDYIPGGMNYYDLIDSFEFIVRGCTMHGRELIWQSYIGSIAGEYDRKHDNSYMIFEDEPDNEHDPNAIKIVIKGEHFGTAGYVGKEFTQKIKAILAKTKRYRIDLMYENEIGQREMHLVMRYEIPG